MGGLFSRMMKLLHLDTSSGLGNQTDQSIISPVPEDPALNPAPVNRYAPGTPLDLRSAFDQATPSGMGSDVLSSMAKVENNFKNEGTSARGAQGMMQFMPNTMTELDRLGFGEFNPNSATESANAASFYLKNLLDRFGSLPLALAAYNAGPGRVRQYGGIPPFPETQNYVKEILGLIDQSQP